MKLRSYQTDAVNAVIDYFERGESGHPLIWMPTATGKSLVIAALVQRLVTEYTGVRVLMLTHVKELISQNLDKLLRVWPDAPVGVYSAGLKQSDVQSPILYCGIQSVWNKARILANSDSPIELVFIDECHRVPLNSDGTYRKFIRDLTEINPYMRIIGLTATPYRYVPPNKDINYTGGYQKLIEGDDRIFTDIVFDLSEKIVSLINDDYLAALWPVKTVYQVNLKNIKIEKGDYKTDELNDLMEKDVTVNSIIDEAVALAQAENRKHWLIFCTSVKSANAMTQELRTRGINAETVTGETPSDERAAFIAAFQAGQLTALVSVMVLTTGFDAPITDCLIIARPTQSPVLHVQMMGRGMRPTDSKIAMEGDRKRGCLVLDFVGNVERHGAINGIKLCVPKEKQEGDEIPNTKLCPNCKTDVYSSCRKCPECGYEFPVKPSGEKEMIVSTLPIIDGLTPLAELSKPERYEITNVFYSHYIGKSGIPTLKVDYYSGRRLLTSEWICLEHSGYARMKAEKWWHERGGATLHGDDHETVELALAMYCNTGMRFVDYLKKPTAMHLKFPDTKNGFPKIVKYEWPIE